MTIIFGINVTEKYGNEQDPACLTLCSPFEVDKV